MPFCRPSVGCLGQLGIGRDPNADDDRVGPDVAAVGQPHAFGPACGRGDLRDLDADPQVDPVVAVQVGEDLSRLPADARLLPMSECCLDACLYAAQHDYSSQSRPVRSGGSRAISALTRPYWVIHG